MTDEYDDAPDVDDVDGALADDEFGDDEGTADSDDSEDSDVDDDAAIADEGLDVDPAMRERLADIAAAPLSEHAEGYQQIHTDLQQALADIDAS